MTHSGEQKTGTDYIVVGGGSSGCIIAAQLAHAGASVLLVEAGGSDLLQQVADPLQGFALASTDLVRQYGSQSTAALNHRSVPVGQGQVLGGGGSVNVMIWTRGFASDFASWLTEGCEGWAFDEVLPYFKRLEDWEGGSTAYRAAGGPIPVRNPRAPSSVALAWIAAGVETGLEQLDDINAPMRRGVGLANQNIDREGLRCSAARAYLHPAMSLPNLTVVLNTQVSRLLFKSGRCVGCQLVDASGERDTWATQEVIVAAGGIGTPHLLLRSGVGCASDLRKAGVAIHSDLPETGRNYQDHPMTRCMVLRSSKPLPAPAAGSNHAEACSFLDSGEGDGGAPDLLAIAIDQPTVTPSGQARYGEAPPPGQGFSLAFGLMRPTSRGSVRLADGDWRTPPIIDNGLLQTEVDLKTAVRGVQYLREVAATKAFRELSDGEAIPGPRIGRADFADLVRDTTHTFWHPVGTCRMGRVGNSVVDSRLRVHGIDGLRVCDSSIMPSSVSCPTNAASCMIGLKAADMILAARSAQPSVAPSSISR